MALPQFELTSPSHVVNVSGFSSSVTYSITQTSPNVYTVNIFAYGLPQYKVTSTGSEIDGQQNPIQSVYYMAGTQVMT